MTVNELIKNSKTNRGMQAVYVTGKGWYRWNANYKVYNSIEDYEQLQRDDANIDYERSSRHE